jgi:hypothetical protein
MAIDIPRLDDFASIDEVVSNQRSRAYRPGTPYGNVAASGQGVYGTLWMTGTGVPTNFTAGQTGLTITAAQLGGGIIVQSPNTTVTWTLDTATNIQNYMINNSAGIQVGDILVCDVINASATTANTITISPGTNNSFDTGQAGLVLAGGTSRTLFIRVATLGASPTCVVYG